MKKEKEKPKAMTRVNTRIRADQSKYIKKMAKKLNKTEGEIFRATLDNGIKLII